MTSLEWRQFALCGSRGAWSVDNAVEKVLPTDVNHAIDELQYGSCLRHGHHLRHPR